MLNLLQHTAGFDDMHFNERYNLTDPPDLSLLDVLARNPASRRVRWRPGHAHVVLESGLRRGRRGPRAGDRTPLRRRDPRAHLHAAWHDDQQLRADARRRSRLWRVATTAGPARQSRSRRSICRPAGNLHTSAGRAGALRPDAPQLGRNRRPAGDRPGIPRATWSGRARRSRRRRG